MFPCKEILSRNEANFRAEKTFEIQSNQSDDERKLNNIHFNIIKSSQIENFSFNYITIFSNGKSFRTQILYHLVYYHHNKSFEYFN